MSTYLNFYNALINAIAPTSAAAASYQSTFSSILSTNYWQILRQAVTPTAITGTFSNPSNAFDMNPTTSASVATMPAYIAAQITAGFVPTVMYVQADPTQGSVTYNNQSPLTFTLDWSTDGTVWNTLQPFSGQNYWQGTERRKYTIVGAAAVNGGVPPQYWRINVTASNSGTTVYIADWCLEDANGNWLTNVNFFDCIPPLTDPIAGANPIGNSVAREVLRWVFNAGGTSISLRPVQELLTAIPQLWSFNVPTAGAVTLSVTINGATVSYVGILGNSAYQNARGLYEAIRASVNANFTAYNWYWPNGLTGYAAAGYFFATLKVPGPNTSITGSNITPTARGTYHAPMVQGGGFASASSITTDPANGWIYYLELNTRGITLGAKTNSVFSTPVHACYGDNASALSQLPVSDLAAIGLPCTPIELMVGTDDVVANTGGSSFPTHFWGVVANAALASYVTPNNCPDYSNFAASTSFFSHNIVPGMLQDWCSNGATQYYGNYSGAVGGQAITMIGEGLYSGGDCGNLYSIHRLGALSQTYWEGAWAGVRVTNPSYSNLDWYKYSGGAPTNEQLLIAPMQDFMTTISTTGTPTDLTINVSGNPIALGFPSTGWIIIDGEIINYSGLTTSSFTLSAGGRGKYATTPVTPIAGTNVYIAGWFVFLVQGLVFAGYQLPS